MAERRPTDDGYRGWLYNPETGRKFRANSTTSRRTDLERISGPDAKPIFHTSKPEKAVQAMPEAEVKEAVEANSSDAADAIADLLEQAQKADKDKTVLKTIGAQLGVKLTQNMNAETMLDRIETQVELIQAAGG